MAKIKDKKSNNKKATTTLSTNNDVYHKILWYLICLFVIIIFIKQYKKDPEATEGKKIKGSFKTYFNGIYQDYYEDYLFKKPFIKGLKKIKNNYEFVLFDKVN